MVDIFVSYCQKDKVYADYMDLYFKDKDINIHRDIRDIEDWKSIREYMQTIRDMDYAVLIITDNYLKSFNCMYEVLEVMKDRKYKDKIFPVVVETSIYSSQGKLQYIKFWEQRYDELNNQLKQVEVVNLGLLPEDLKRTQSIASSMSEFLCLVADMNNPDISDVNIAIENKLIESGLLSDVVHVSTGRPNPDIFSSLNIPRVYTTSEPSDLEKNRFMIESFKRINQLLGQLCQQLQNENINIQTMIDQVDTRTLIYQFYKNGNQIRGLKLFIGNTFGGREMNIGISDAISVGSNNSYNGIYSSKLVDGQLSLYSMISFSMNQKAMSVEEAVKDIWESYINPYLER